MADDSNKQLVEYLKTACDEAFVAHPGSCSHSVWYVIKKYIPEQTWKNANALIKELSSSAVWQEVKAGELSKLANEGVLVVGGATETGNGHVIVVYPGTEKHDGGYYTTSRKTGEKVLVKSTGTYARSMSTSMGNWVGAKSGGDKTVYDPWRDKFYKVKFWKYNGTRQEPKQKDKK
jgi:hypothetical protein